MRLKLIPRNAREKYMNEMIHDKKSLFIDQRHSFKFINTSIMKANQLLNEHQVEIFNKNATLIDLFDKEISYLDHLSQLRGDLYSYYIYDEKIKNPLFYKYINIDQVYYITLHPDDVTQKSRIERLTEIFGDQRLNVINAVNALENPFVFKDFGLSLNPISEDFILNFSTSIGAVGCFLSHYKIYLDIIKNKYQNCLFLEDDVCIESLDKFYKKTTFVPRDYEFMQLNSRVFDKGYPFTSMPNIEVDGTESYLMTFQGAVKMVELTYNFPYKKFYNVDRFQQWLSRVLPKETGFKNIRWDSRWFFEENDNAEIKKNILAPIDKFLSICSSVNQPEGLVSYEIPIIDLDKSLSESSEVVTETPHWQTSIEQIQNPKNHFKKYKWWEK